MRLFFLPAVLAALSWLAMPVVAQDPPRGAADSDASSSPTAAPSIVVLDVALVFKSHLRFKQRMNTLRGEADRYDKEVSSAHQEILAGSAKLKDFKSGSVEYKKIEEQVHRDLAELRIKDLARKNEFFDREGKIYFDTYQEILAAVDHLATRHGISLVLKYNSDETDPFDRGSILKSINRDVVFQKRLDITKLVIEHVNGREVAAKTEAGSKRQR